jgi:hypothetical protein
VAKSYDGEKAWSSMSHSILSGLALSLPHPLIPSPEQTPYTKTRLQCYFFQFKLNMHLHQVLVQYLLVNPGFYFYIFCSSCYWFLYLKERSVLVSIFIGPPGSGFYIYWSIRFQFLPAYGSKLINATGFSFYCYY